MSSILHSMRTPWDWSRQSRLRPPPRGDRPLAREEPEEIRDLGVAMTDAVGRPHYAKRLSSVYSSTLAARMAAPVGVVVSLCTAPALYGNAREELDDRGGRHGNEAVLAFHEAPAELDAREQSTRSGARYSMPIAAPTMSTIESTAPTSWKPTSSTTEPCTFASARASLPKMAAARSSSPPGGGSPRSCFRMSRYARWRWIPEPSGPRCAESPAFTGSGRISTSALVPDIPIFEPGEKRSLQPRQAELRELGHEMILGNAEIDEGGEGHVAAIFPKSNRSIAPFPRVPEFISFPR